MEATGHPLRILMSTTVFPRWRDDSTPPFILRLAEGLTRAGCAVTVLAPHADGAALREQWGDVEIIRFRYLWPTSLQGLCYEGGMLVQLRRHPHRRWQLPFLLLAQIRAVRQRCLGDHFDLLHAHSLLPQGFTALFQHRLPVVTTSHGNDVFGLKNTGPYGKMKRWVVARSHALTANSSATEAALIRLGGDPERIHRIPAAPNIVEADPGRAAAIRESMGLGEGLLVLFVGRLLEEKGVGDLLEGIHQLRDLPTVKLIILGDGADRPQFDSFVERVGLRDRVRFGGWAQASELAAHYQAADLVVVPSKPGPDGWIEAQGLVCVEAMAAGTPVIGSRCGGIPDMVRHEETGLLVAPGAPNQIAAAIRRLALDKELRASMAMAARQRFASAFSIEVTTSKLLRLFAEIHHEWLGR